MEFHTYAMATLDDLFTPQELEGAGVLKAELLSTVYLENTGSGFQQKTFPAEAQYAPIYAMDVVDANGDGKKDLVLGGNIHGQGLSLAATRLTTEPCCWVTEKEIFHIHCSGRVV